MSRVDEALRLAQRAALRAPRDTAVTDELRTHDVDPSILDRFGAERPAKSLDHFQSVPAQPMPVPVQQSAPAPRVSPPLRAVRYSPALEGKLVISQMVPVAMEQYRRLAAVLHDLRLENGPKTLTVSSASLHEGKTLTIANLALTLSESYHQRVLLIDADLRRPSVHEVFGVENGPGLADIGRGAAVRPPYVELSSCLSLLTAGHAVANPLAILTSDQVRALVADAASKFDWVLIDTPPVGLLPDAQLVARLTEGVLFVIAAGVTPYALIKRCIAELGADRIVGTVLNRVERRTLPTDNYGSYYADALR